MNDLLSIISRFSQKRVLVIGDAIVDAYVCGESKRLSPEAPVPVVDVQEEKFIAGGAANTAVNLRHMLADVSLYTVIGQDDKGRKLLDSLVGLGIYCHGVISDPERQTIVKTRVLSGRQSLVRYDVGTSSPITGKAECGLLELLKAEGPAFHAIVVSDYGKGVVTDTMINALAILRKVYGTYIAVDSKRLQVFSSVQPSLIKPNYSEAIELINTNAQGSNRASQIRQCGDALYSKTRARTTAVTMDCDGAVIFEGARPRHNVQAARIAFPSGCGAGDTFISAYTLASISGAELKQASELATAAARVVVSKEGTAWCSAAELKLPFMFQQKCIRTWHDLKELCEMYRGANRTVVFTNGCFDILHSGHVNYLNTARSQGDVLIVGINTDESISRLKGDHRPINPIHERVSVLAGLTAVDHIVEFGDVQDDTPSSVLEVVRPHVFVKGNDYEEKDLPEADVVRRYGGKIVLLPLTPGKSTTRIVQKIGFSNVISSVARS
jgi:D-beta-D-heptose 7-phosphate kinase/D-beta-D-heptose 1-phosphate adenosyltransferase